MEKGFISSTIDYHIMLPMADKFGTCRISAIVDMVIHAGTVACEALGVGVHTLHNNNLAWVLTNLSVKMTKLPLFYDKIKIVTWLEGKVFSLLSRNFAIYNDKDELIGGASTYWAVIDMDKRSTIDIATLNILQYVEKKPSVIGRPVRVKPKEGETIATRKVLYSDMDYNRHMYSVRYIDHIIDVMTIESVNDKPFMSVDACFHNEIMEAEEYRISVLKEKGGDVYSIYRSDGKPAAAVRLKVD